MTTSKNQTGVGGGFTGYQALVIALLAVMQFTVVLGFTVIVPLGDMMITGLGIDTARFGLLVSCYAFGACISGLIAASTIDRFDRKKFLLFFYVGYLGGMFLCGSAQTYPLLLAARCITGLFGGVISSISFAIIADLFAINQRGRVMGFVQMAFSVSQIVGIPLGLLLANRWGWNSAFLAIGILSALVSLAIAVGLKPIAQHLTLQDNTRALQRLWQVLSHRRYLTGYVLILFISVGGAMLMPFSATFLVNNVGVMPQGQLPLVFFCTGIASTLFMPLIGRLSDKYPKHHIFLLGSLVGIVMTAVYTHLTPVPLWLVITVNIIMYAGVSGRMIPGSALNTAVPAPQDRGAYLSLCSSLQQMSNGIGALLAGSLIVQQAPGSPLQHFEQVGYVVMAISVLSIFLVYRIARIVASAQTETGQGRLKVVAETAE